MTGKRKISIIKRLLIALPLALMLLATGSGYWMLRTNSGAAWFWAQLQDASAGAVSSSGMDGDFTNGVRIRNLVYQSDSLRVTVGNLVIQAGIAWWPVALEVTSLTMVDVEITNKQAGDQAPLQTGNTDIGTVLSSLEISIPLLIEQATINKVTLRQGDGSPQTVADSIEFSATLKQQSLLTELKVEADGFFANLNADLQLISPFDLNASIEGVFEPRVEHASVNLKLPFKAMVEGQVDNWVFELDTSIQSAQSHSAMLVASGTGTSRAIDIRMLSLNGKGVDLELRGAFDWSSTADANFNAVIRQLDLSPWLDDWPVGSFIEGSFDMKWSENGLTIPLCALTVSGTDLSLQLEADIDIADNSVNARLQWRNLDWPLADANALVSSPSGQLNLSGRIDQWTAAGQVEISFAEYPRGIFDIRAVGGRRRAHLLVAEGAVLGGSIRGEVDADWADSLNWKAIIQAKEIDLAPIFPEWPGQLSAELEVESIGHLDTARIKISGLEGHIRDVPVYAQGTIQFSDKNPGFDQFKVRTDQAVMMLDGNAAGPVGISVTYNGELPAVLLAGVSGSIAAEARFSSHADGQILELDLQTQDLAWKNYQVKVLSIQSQSLGPVPELQLNATDVSLADFMLDEVSLDMASVGDKHSLSVNISGKNVTFSSAGFVTPEHDDRPFSGGWLTVFTDMKVAIKQQHIFSLLEPAKLNWSIDKTTLDSLCMTETSAAKICLSGDFAPGGGRSLVADVSNVPVNYLRDLFELDVQFDQLLEGRFEWHQAIGQAPTGGADFRITAGEIIDFEDQHVLTRSREGRFGFTLQNGNLESGTLDLEFPGSGYIDMDFEVLDIASNGARTLKGRAFAQLEDIKMLGQLVLPVVDEISGRFESDIQLGGTLTEPTFKGGFNLSDGLVKYAPIGLMLEDIELEGQLDQLDRGNFKGEFRAGEGLGSINGQILFRDFEDIQLQADFSGAQLLLLDTEQLKLNAETDINVALGSKRLDINGKIRIPSAYFSASNLSTGGVVDSEDLVIEPVAGKLEEAVVQDSAAYRVYGDLEVLFGDDVLIEVPGVEAKLAGSVVFSWDGDRLPVAQGSYVLNGIVDFYGPTLQINNGHISFPGVAADNPILNIRAAREVFGNTQIRSAGVQLIGTLKHPQFEAYTVPVTNEDRAWTILVTGTDFDQGQGVNGFDVGTYIAPRLYVSYGISLFDDDSVISARYDLKKGFGIKVSSGQRETGLDVSYTIDK